MRRREKSGMSGRDRVAAASAAGGRVLLQQTVAERSPAPAADAASAAAGAAERRHPTAGGAAHARSPSRNADRPGYGRDPVRRLGRGPGAHRLPVPAGERRRSGLRRRMGRSLHAPARHPRQHHALERPERHAGRRVLHRADGGQGLRPLGRRPGAQRSELPAGQGRPRRGGGPDRGARRTQNYPAGNNAAFDTSGATPYAFGFDTVAATIERHERQPRRAPALADYAQMAADGCAVLYVGTATFNGTQLHLSHRRQPERRLRPAIYVRASWPAGRRQSVPFHLCFKSPTSLRQLPEPRQRSGARRWRARSTSAGSSSRAAQSVIGQVTIHTDHPFWDSVLHDSPAHFDQFAARVAGMGPRGPACRSRR